MKTKINNGVWKEFQHNTYQQSISLESSNASKVIFRKISTILSLNSYVLELASHA